MLSIKGLNRFIDRQFLLKLFYLSLLYSLVPFGEIALLLYLKAYFGTYLLLALVLATGLLGIAVAWRQVSRGLAVVKTQVADGEYPEDGFAQVAGALISGLLLITPGFATDALGLIISFRIVGRGVGKLVTSRMEERLKEMYEYMKL